MNVKDAMLKKVQATRTQPRTCSALSILARAQGTTATPADLHWPTTLLAIASSETCFKWSSRCLILAISYTCLTLSVPAGATFGRPASPDADSIPAACLTSHMVGGDFVTNVKVRSGWIVIVTGVGVPGVSEAVRAVRSNASQLRTRRATWKGGVVPLNSLTKSILLTPRAPSAGPIGGAAVALPAGTMSLCVREAN